MQAVQQNGAVVERFSSYFDPPASNFTNAVLNCYQQSPHNPLSNNNPSHSIQGRASNLQPPALVRWLQEVHFFSSPVKTQQELSQMISHIQENGAIWGLENIEEDFNRLSQGKDKNSFVYYYSALSLFLDRIFEKATQNELNDLAAQTPKNRFKNENISIKYEQWLIKNPALTSALSVTLIVASLLFGLFITPTLCSLVWTPLFTSVANQLLLMGVSSTLVSTFLTATTYWIALQRLHIPLKLGHAFITYNSEQLKQPTKIGHIVNGIGSTLTLPSDIFYKILLYPFSVNPSKPLEFAPSDGNMYEIDQKLEIYQATKDRFPEAYMRWRAISTFALSVMIPS